MSCLVGDELQAIRSIEERIVQEELKLEVLKNVLQEKLQEREVVRCEKQKKEQTMKEVNSEHQFYLTKNKKKYRIRFFSVNFPFFRWKKWPLLTL